MINKKIFVIIFFLSISIIVLSNLLLRDEYFHLVGDNSIPPYKELIKNWAVKRFYSWNSANFGYSFGYPTELPLDWLVLGLSYFISANLIIKSMFFIFIFGSCYGMFLVSHNISKKYIPSIIVSLFYALNPFVFNKLVMNHIWIILGYMFLPYIFYLIVLNENKRYKWIGVILLIVSSGTLLKYALINFIIISLGIFIEKGINFKNIKYLFTIFILTILINSFWLFPLALSRSTYLPNSQNTNQFERLSVEPAYSFIGLGYIVDFYKIELLKISPLVFLILFSFVIFGFLGLLFEFNPLVRRKLIFYSLSLLAFVFYLFIFKTNFSSFILAFVNKLFVFSIFREVYNVSLLVSFILSIMLSYSLKILTNVEKMEKILMIFIVILIIPLIIIFARIGNHFPSYNYSEYEKDWLEYQTIFENDPEIGSYRSLIVPPRSIFMIGNNTWSRFGRDTILQNFFGGIEIIDADEYTQSYDSSIQIQNLLKEMGKSCSNSSIRNFDTRLSSFSIKYVLVRKEKIFPLINISEINHCINKSESFRLIHSNHVGDLYIHNNFLPKVIKFDYDKNLIKNPSFSYDLKNWNITNSGYKIGLDSNESWISKNSIRIITSSNKTKQWSNLYSSEIDSKFIKDFLFMSHVKTQNVVQSHVVLEGFNNNTKKWIQISQNPSGIDGTNEWKEYLSKIHLDNNVIKIRVNLKAGDRKDTKEAEAITWIDDVYIIRYNSSQKIQKASPVRYSLFNFSNSTEFSIYFGESYSRDWEILSNEDYINFQKHNFSNEYGNSWYVNSSNNLSSIIVYYKPQDWFYVGLVVSLITFFLCMVYVIHDYIKNKSRPPIPDYKGHAYTEAIFELHQKGKISEEEVREYLKRQYNEREVKLLLKNMKKK